MLYSYQSSLFSVLLVYHKRPGGVYREQKSISERETAENGENQSESSKEEGEKMEGESSLLLHRKRPGDRRHGAAVLLIFLS